jgi:hypothetical protein
VPSRNARSVRRWIGSAGSRRASRGAWHGAT